MIDHLKDEEELQRCQVDLAKELFQSLPNVHQRDESDNEDEVYEEHHNIYHLTVKMQKMRAVL